MDIRSGDANLPSASTAGKLPYIGDAVVLLTCPRQVREELRAIGLHGGNDLELDSKDRWINQLPAGQASVSQSALVQTLAAWLEIVRNEAAMSGTICTAWMESMPPEIAQGIRDAAGADLLEINVTETADAVRQIEARAKRLPQTAGKIFAVCSIRNGGIELLPHWLEHYSKLGADRLLVGIFDDVPQASRAEIEQYAQKWRFVSFKQTWNTHHELVHEEQRRSACRALGALPDTWILHTDLDEFHEFPAPLWQIVACAEADGTNAVNGNFMDRVAADGALAAVRVGPPSIWEQFPIQCRLTERVLRAWTKKVMLAKFEVPCGPGHHVASNVRSARVPIGQPDQYIVHHFKWHAELPARMEWAIAQPNSNPIWKTEARRFLNWLAANGGRINLAEAAGANAQVQAA